MTMGPEPKTEKFREQVDRIRKMLSAAKTIKEVDKIALLYVFDPSYSRAAILQAVHQRQQEIQRGEKS